MEDSVRNYDIWRFFLTPYFWPVFISWTIAQTSKPVVAYFRTRKWNWEPLLNDGGMPSAHSALICSVATSIGIYSGFGSPVFLLALATAGIVMHDASGVRRATGNQAKVLNVILDEILVGNENSFEHLKELIGHEPIEVLMGSILGIVVPIIWSAIITI